MSTSDFAMENYLENHDPEPVECFDCEGRGSIPVLFAHGVERIDCDTCDGDGVVEA